MDLEGSRRWAVPVVLLAFAVLFTALRIGSYTRMSATWDEPIHLTAGYAALAQRDYRIDSEHPPFLRMWAALPLLAMHVNKLNTSLIDQTPPTEMVSRKLFDFCHQFMYVDNDADRLLYVARFMVVLLGVLLGVLVFCWMNEWLGFRAAVIALAFYTLEPNLAAHASLVTTDLGVTCFMFGAVYFLWRTCRRPSAMNIGGLTGFFALAIISKYSALILVPVVGGLLALAALRFRTIRLSMALRILAVLALTSWIAIWAVYGFRYAPGASASWRMRFQDQPLVRQRQPKLAAVVDWIDSRAVLPNAFTQGFLLCQTKAQHREAFLFGRYSDQGWSYYFPAAFLIKTPLALVALLLAGVVLLATRWRRQALETWAFVALPAALYMALAMMTPINVGLRHILPIYPFVLLMAGGAAAAFMTTWGRRGRLALGVLAALWLVEWLRVYPHDLAFFNQLAGGPRHGFQCLVDSNLDWGQDLKPLKAWMERNGVAHINLAYFGSADPAYYHIDCTHLPGAPWFVPESSIAPPRLPGYVAASATILSGVNLNDRGRAFYKPLREQRPVAEIGYSIRVYWVERPWW